jgi:HEAT repeat protein
MKPAHSPEIQMEPTSTPTFQDSLPKPVPTLADALDSIGQGSPHVLALKGLSDLSRDQTAEFARHWIEFTEETRVRVVQQLEELAEDSVELTFGRALRVALDDPSPAVRQLAVDALWEDMSSDLGERLLDLVETDDSQDVRAAAAQGLAKFANAVQADDADPVLRNRIWTRLYETASDESQPYMVRRRALESVAVFGDQPEVEQLITDAYAADDAGYHAGALYAMGRTLDERWLDILIAELESDDAEMRYEAARALGEIGDVRALRGLSAAAIDEDAEVRQEAIMALGLIGGRGAEEILRRLAKSASPADLQAIADALGEAVDELA